MNHILLGFILQWIHSWVSLSFLPASVSRFLSVLQALIHIYTHTLIKSGFHHFREHYVTLNFSLDTYPSTSCLIPCPNPLLVRLTPSMHTQRIQIKTVCLCPLCRSWRLVSSALRQVPVAGGGSREANTNYSCCHAGPLWQLWLAYGLPVDVQRHRTQLEKAPTGRQLRGNSSTTNK